jgi:hypothetical protein
MWKKREKKRKKFGEGGYRNRDLLVKNFSALPSALWRRRYTSRNNAYIVIFRTKVEISTTGRCTIFRHNKHSNFYKTVNIRRLILGKYFNFKTTQL